MTINTNPGVMPNHNGGQLSRTAAHHQSSTSLHSLSQFSPSNMGNLVLATPNPTRDSRLTNRSAVSGNMRPDSRIFVTQTSQQQRSFYTKPPIVYLARDHMWTEDGTHL
ncbi:hypothetical protein BV898_04041 [Hypsibius exemplaris]|uniref:Uncharacterized protein n=1 Tax=Hypsibius exemplaris TaxID=2072580 RepID=A0A1W0X4J4_HYPEX|nr:hypothetical protein BV898_04041 [Hypsibius exemplaris]